MILREIFGLLTIFRDSLPSQSWVAIFFTLNSSQFLPFKSNSISISHQHAPLTTPSDAMSDRELFCTRGWHGSRFSFNLNQSTLNWAKFWASLMVCINHSDCMSFWRSHLRLCLWKVRTQRKFDLHRRNRDSFVAFTWLVKLLGWISLHSTSDCSIADWIQYWNVNYSCCDVYGRSLWSSA